MKADGYGWMDYITVRIVDDEVELLEFDAKNEDGDLKSEDAGYNTAMDQAVGTCLLYTSRCV